MDRRFDCCRYQPSLDDLLADEVMEPVLRSAGLDQQELREMMVETARRIEDRDRGIRCWRYRRRVINLRESETRVEPVNQVDCREALRCRDDDAPLRARG